MTAPHVEFLSSGNLSPFWCCTLLQYNNVAKVRLRWHTQCPRLVYGFSQLESTRFECASRIIRAPAIRFNISLHRCYVKLVTFFNNRRLVIINLENNLDTATLVLLNWNLINIRNTWLKLFFELIRIIWISFIRINEWRARFFPRSNILN